MNVKRKEILETIKILKETVELFDENKDKKIIKNIKDEIKFQVELLRNIVENEPERLDENNNVVESNYMNEDLENPTDEVIL